MPASPRRRGCAQIRRQSSALRPQPREPIFRGYEKGTEDATAGSHGQKRGFSDQLLERPCPGSHRLRVWEFPCVVQNFWSRSIEPHQIVPAPHNGKAVRNRAVAAAELDSDRDDARALLYTYGYIAIKRPGTAQFYLISIRDKDGDGFDGAKTYRLHVPANAPVEQYWSVTKTKHWIAIATRR
jgi:Protein of unknown function (DUF1214)